MKSVLGKLSGQGPGALHGTLHSALGAQSLPITLGLSGVIVTGAVIFGTVMTDRMQTPETIPNAEGPAVPSPPASPVKPSPTPTPAPTPTVSPSALPVPQPSPSSVPTVSRVPQPTARPVVPTRPSVPPVASSPVVVPPAPTPTPVPTPTLTPTPTPTPEPTVISEPAHVLSVLGGRLVLHVKLVDGAVVNISPIGIADFSEGCRLDAAHGVLKDLVGRWVALERIGEGTTDSSGYTRRIVRVDGTDLAALVSAAVTEQCASGAPASDPTPTPEPETPSPPVTSEPVITEPPVSSEQPVSADPPASPLPDSPGNDPATPPAIRPESTPSVPTP